VSKHQHNNSQHIILLITMKITNKMHYID